MLQNFEKTVFKRHSAEESLSSPESNVSSLSSSELQNYQQLVSMVIFSIQINMSLNVLIYYKIAQAQVLLSVKPEFRVRERVEKSSRAEFVVATVSRVTLQVSGAVFAERFHHVNQEPDQQLSRRHL